FQYDLHPYIGQPRRLDVVVFKFPGGDPDPRKPGGGGPQDNHVPMNYIKRLLGLPGETIAICCGHLYRLPPGIIDYGTELDESGKSVNPLDLWRRRYMHEDDPQALDLFDKSDKFGIIRKPPDKQISMSRIVYDHDYPADDLKGVLPLRWSGDGWKEDNP